MFSEPGAFVCTSGRGMCPIQSGGHRDCFDTRLMELSKHETVHGLSDPFEPGIRPGGIVADCSDTSFDMPSDKTDDLTVMFADGNAILTAVDLIFDLKSL